MDDTAAPAEQEQCEAFDPSQFFATLRPRRQSRMERVRWFVLNLQYSLAPLRVPVAALVGAYLAHKGWSAGA